MTTRLPDCQACGAPLEVTLVDLGMQPLANAYLTAGQAKAAELLFPLHARFCDRCLLVQVDRVTPPETIFNETYAYFSSFSDSWLEHCQLYTAEMIQRFELGTESQVVEIASNDGYLLQYFAERGISVLGIEPAANVASAARTKGVATEEMFFGVDTAALLADRGLSADLLAAKNVLAHVPDIHDFVAGIPLLLKPGGIFTVEFPHLLNLIQEVQFDTIYHEHFTYLSLLAVQKIFEQHNLTVFDVEEQPTHGGSLRVFACRKGARHAVTDNVGRILQEERNAQLDRREGYQGFDDRVKRVRAGLLHFLDSAVEEGKKVVAYGAAAKGNTLLNYCGVGRERVEFVVDRNPAKQASLLPGSHIPVRAPEALYEAKPEFVLILPWNLRREIVDQLEAIRDWGGRFVTAIPEIRVD